MRHTLSIDGVCNTEKVYTSNSVVCGVIMNITPKLIAQAIDCIYRNEVTVELDALDDEPTDDDKIIVCDKNSKGYVIISLEYFEKD